MAELNLVDDRQTARQIVERCIYKGYGLQRAKQALYEKQIPKSLWEEALESYPDQTDAITRFLEQRIKDPTDPKQVKRAIDAALRRGHSYGQIKGALEQIGSEIEEEY
jgi:SOS response regulatory protein OraA/RecX